jgi:septal ring factor EnvC (AmiA/AmiB activator)
MSTEQTNGNGTAARLEALEREQALIRTSLHDLRNEVQNDRLTVHVKLASIEGGINEIRAALPAIASEVKDAKKDIEDVNRWRQRVNTYGTIAVAAWGVFANDIKARFMGGH